MEFKNNYNDFINIKLLIKKIKLRFLKLQTVYLREKFKHLKL